MVVGGRGAGDGGREVGRKRDGGGRERERVSDWIVVRRLEEEILRLEQSYCSLLTALCSQ